MGSKVSFRARQEDLEFKIFKKVINPGPILLRSNLGRMCGAGEEQAILILKVLYVSHKGLCFLPSHYV